MNVKTLKETLIKRLNNLIEDCEEELKKKQSNFSEGYERGYMDACKQEIKRIKALK